METTKLIEFEITMEELLEKLGIITEDYVKMSFIGDDIFGSPPKGLRIVVKDAE